MKKALVLTILTALALLAVAGVSRAPEAVVGAADKKDLFNEQSEVVYTDCDLTKPKNPNIENALKTYKAKNPDNSLRALDATDKASFKACEIAKIKAKPRQNVQFSGADYDIEIVDTQYVEGHVEVFARAWTPDGTQIGFGADGTVDIERFRIFNPPVLVEDANGDIVRDDTTSITGPVTRKLREDPTNAILQSLAHTIAVKHEKRTDSVIEAGKRGNTTSTFYPDASPESTSVDGRVYRDTDLSWSAARDTADGLTAIDNDATGFFAAEKTDATHYQVQRVYWLFNTAALSGQTISSATMSWWDTNVTTGGDAVALIQTSPASDTAIGVGDFDALTLNAPAEGATRISSFTPNGYNTFTLNATGKSWISTTGVTKLGGRFAKDVDNTTPSARSYRQIRFADQAGTTNDPKLVVEHTAAGGGAAALPADIIFY